MRIQISNRNVTSYRLFIVFVFMCLALGLTFLPLTIAKPSINFLILSAIFLFIYYILIGRFSKVEIDFENLYFENYRRKGKIALDKVISVKDEPLPYSFFFKTAYGITIRYFNEQGKVKKLKFLSPETSWGGHPFEIPELKHLKSKLVRK